MIIERSLGHPGSGRNGIDPDGANALIVEKPICRGDQRQAGLRGIPGHDQSILTSEYTFQFFREHCFCASYWRCAGPEKISMNRETAGAQDNVSLGVIVIVLTVFAM